MTSCDVVGCNGRGVVEEPGFDEQEHEQEHEQCFDTRTRTDAM